MPTLNHSLGSVKDSENTYKSLKTNEADDAVDELSDDADAVTDDDEDNLIYEINLKSDNHRLCRAKAAHDPVLGKNDAPLFIKTFTAMEAPHLDFKSLIAELDDFAKTIDLDVSTILTEQIKDTVLGTVQSRLHKGIISDVKSPEIQQSKQLLR